MNKIFSIHSNKQVTNVVILLLIICYAISCGYPGNTEPFIPITSNNNSENQQVEPNTLIVDQLTERFENSKIGDKGAKVESLYTIDISANNENSKELSTLTQAKSKSSPHLPAEIWRDQILPNLSMKELKITSLTNRFLYNVIDQVLNYNHYVLFLPLLKKAMISFDKNMGLAKNSTFMRALLVANKAAEGIGEESLATAQVDKLLEDESREIYIQEAEKFINHPIKDSSNMQNLVFMVNDTNVFDLEEFLKKLCDQPNFLSQIKYFSIQPSSSFSKMLDISILQEVLKKMPALKSLVLVNTNIGGIDGLQELVNLVSKIPGLYTLKELTIGGRNVSDEGMEALMNLMEQTPNLKMLHIYLEEASASKISNSPEITSHLFAKMPKEYRDHIYINEGRIQLVYNRLDCILS